MRRYLRIAATCFTLSIAQGAGAQGADVLLNCTSCHTLGPNLNQGATTQELPSLYPNLNGQSARYLQHQLDAYRLGLRQHPQMQATATALGEGAAAMARMYADAPAPKLGLRGGSDTFPDAQALVDHGDWSRGLPPCASCHALDTKDRARLSPRLHGHPETYLADQLRAYADGTRHSDTMGRMRGFASKLTEAEIAELAAYYAAWRAEVADSDDQDEDQPDG